MTQLCIVIFYVLSVTIFLPIVTETRSVFISHRNPSDVKHFESKLDTKVGYWSPVTSSIDWCERNYAMTEYIAEFWNCISSLFMSLLALVLILRGLYNRIEKRLLLMSFSFGLVGLGSAYFHGTLTYVGQMFDELPMVYSMIIWWFILFRMNTFKLNGQIFPFDIWILFGIFYGFFWSYIHSLKAFILVFQVHFAMMCFGGIIKLIYLYRETQYKTHCIKYLIIAYVGLLFPAIISWIIDQQLCQKMNSKNGFNPQLHAWWHIICAVDCHVGIVCAESMRFLSIKSRQYQIRDSKSSQQLFRPKDHLHLVFYFGLPFVDYSKDKQIDQTKNQ